MKEKQLKITFSEYESKDELKDQEKFLITEAEHSAAKAYAHYSGYRVGAAVLLENDEIICANNQENVAFPSGMCAERIALYYAKSRFPDTQVIAIAITADADNFHITSPVSPCGACRQVIAEYEIAQKSPVSLILTAENTKVMVIDGIENLLPLMFKAEELKKI